MPHVILEHTKSLAGDIAKSETLKQVHLAVVGSGLFSPEAVKSRAVVYDQMLWGKQAEPTEFVHVAIKILDGRTVEQRQALSKSVFDILKATLPNVSKLSVEIHEMDKASYLKT